ncbi:MAG: ABC-F family ATP-binding cassette domain-containing protein [Desulfobulbaceae bacterium]|uniref:ABC-F family ATP-binding cassette domain-containing protein n=1 Tax=Candidatus Desulfatifera sulfidica TaxID=2841691 RepID=A0A8J6N918_9BACT|nr:ABC-F family ATP-binding cassette domain-containing protein [Candidatus Desulfatifera sulfidica]
MLSVNHLDIRYGDKYLFKDISQSVYAGNRIGLVGVNGAGKSTLLKIMAGVTGSDDGVITRGKTFTVGYLPQESSALVSDNTLYAEAESAFAEVLALQDEIQHINEQLAVADPESGVFQTLLKRQGEIQQILDASDIYTIRARIEKILLGLGFRQDDLARPVSSFSGGWIMRLMLAKMLLTAPSLLLLDEPTNHLDLDSLTWVEDFLRTYQGAMVIISHDRTFLDRTTEITWEVSLGRLSVYKGNYSYYLREKDERRAVEQAAYDNQQARIRQTMRFVERFRAKSTKAKQVQSRVKQLEKEELIELADDERQIRFTFPPAPPSGRDVLRVRGVGKQYQGQWVFREADVQFQRGDKVAVVGVNGAGKSTFLKLLSGEIEPDEGDVIFGHNVQRSYFGQHQAQELSPSLSALDTMALAGEGMTVTQTRSLLGAFLFRGEEVDKKVAVLSGGEKSRLALARMIATPANCMLLDEPTNHLDMSSQDVLQEAMAQYDGFIIVVSHNRYFLDSFVNKVLEVRDGRVAIYEGNISDYLNKLAREQEAACKSSSEGGKGSATNEESKAAGQLSEKSALSRKAQRRLEAQARKDHGRKLGPWKEKVKEAEATIEKLEERKVELETLMADPELYQDQQAWSAASNNYDDCTSRLKQAYEQWEEAQVEIDRAGAEMAT